MFVSILSLALLAADTGTATEPLQAGIERSSAPAPGPVGRGSLQANVSLPRLKGLGLHVAKVERRRAKVSKDLSALSHAALVLICDVALAYWDLVQANEDLSLRGAP
jgi:hypothetical protein